ncbi:glycosyl transferase, partial [Priestia megaterium]
FLREVLKSHLTYIDNAVIIDDCSTDNSVEICKEVLKTVPCRVVQNRVSKFSNEVELRKQQWEETIKTEPNWI